MLKTRSTDTRFRRCLKYMARVGYVVVSVLTLLFILWGTSYNDDTPVEVTHGGVTPVAMSTVSAGPETPATRSLLKARIKKLKIAVQKIWCKSHNVLYDGGFCISFNKLKTGGNMFFDVKLCRHIEDLVGTGSIVDFGAGLGLYGMCLLRKTSTPFQAERKEKQEYMTHFKDVMGDLYNTRRVVHSWHGFDSATNIGNLSGGFIHQVDLSKKGLWLGRRWDWVMSVEVGEHIPPKRETDFIDNMVRHACKGVLLTWSVIGQGGLEHVNNHNNNYIKTKMRDRGLTNDEEVETKMRENLDLPWLKDTTMVFRVPHPTNCL